MSSETTPIHDLMERPTDTGWRRLLLSWPVLFLAALLLYEFTSMPGLAAFLTCIKFGWNDLQAARWLRRYDPNRKRGATCFWFYLAFATWKVAMLSLAMMVAVLLVANWIDQLFKFGQGLQGLMEGIQGMLSAAALGFVSSCCITFIAAVLAWRRGVKVWLGSAPQLARRKQYWPPDQGTTNWLPAVLLTMLIPTIVIVWLLCLLITVPILLWFQLPMPEWACALLGVGSLFLITVLMFVGFGALSTRLSADSPSACWGTCSAQNVLPSDETSASEHLS